MLYLRYFIATLLSVFIFINHAFRSLVDSLPIVTCKGRNRKGKVARELADKGYCDTDLDALEQTDNLTLLTPVKLVKGETEVLRMREQAYRDVLSRAVSAVRQPIAAAFIYLIF